MHCRRKETGEGRKDLEAIVQTQDSISIVGAGLELLMAKIATSRQNVTITLFKHSTFTVRSHNTIYSGYNRPSHRKQH